MISLYKFDDDKLKIIRIMAGHIVDLENHYDILMRLDFNSNKRKALDILNIQQKKIIPTTSATCGSDEDVIEN